MIGNEECIFVEYGGCVYSVYRTFEGRWAAVEGRWAVDNDRELFAMLDETGHSAWAANPGLREALITQLAIQRMVYL